MKGDSRLCCITGGLWLFPLDKTSDEPYFELGPLMEGFIFAFRGRARNGAGYGGIRKFGWWRWCKISYQGKISETLFVNIIVRRNRFLRERQI